MLVGICLVMLLASSAAASGPPTEHVARGACPFECCVYRTWTVEKDTVLRASPDVHARVMGRLKAGSRVDAITGEVHARPVRFVVTAAHERYTPGDELCVYFYLGEGRFTVWRHGAMYEEDLGFSPHGGSPGARWENPAQCWGRLDRDLRATWWVKVRSSDGGEGWSNQAEHFGHKDACAASAADEPPGGRLRR